MSPLLLSSPSPSPSPSPPLDPVAVSEDLTPLPQLKAAGNADLSFDGLLRGGLLKYHEDVRSGCGGQTWPAGWVLGKHMLRYHRDDLREARMLVSPCAWRSAQCLFHQLFCSNAKYVPVGGLDPCRRRVKMEE